MNTKPKLLVQVRDRLRLLHRSYHTEKQYLAWMTVSIAFCNRHEPDKTTWRHPKDGGRHEVEVFLTHLAVDKHVVASTQNHALCALVFLYKDRYTILLDNVITPLQRQQVREFYQYLLV
ncbi:MAG: hypothetical protein GY797_21965 [Deltaproteobacteria bacterium]|nr:hypothetical protein [Deltaproteobacteria bacterium]